MASRANDRTCDSRLLSASHEEKNVFRILPAMNECTMRHGIIIPKRGAQIRFDTGFEKSTAQMNCLFRDRTAAVESVT